MFFHDITARRRSDAALREVHAELERRVETRTRELSEANDRLVRQIARRKRVEAARTELQRLLVLAQEDEHRRVARELHDDLTQRLALMAIESAAITQMPGCTADIGDRLRGMREQLATFSQDIHGLSRHLHPSVLDDLGLLEAVRSECDGVMRRCRIEVEFHAHGLPSNIPRDVALCVYRVVQESLRNIACHSRSDWASVRLSANERKLVVYVRDRGVGFEVAAPGKRGLGLESMRERARLIRGRVEVSSRKGRGTEIVLRVPLQGNEL